MFANKLGGEREIMSEIYVFHQGRGDNGQLWYNVFDGEAWEGDRKAPNTGLTAGPSAVVYDDEIWVLHQGRGDNGWVWCNIFDGEAWEGDEALGDTGISQGPGAVVY